jgi:hypothetical protein
MKGSAIKVYRPGLPRWSLWRWDYYHVIVDGIDVGEVWPRQTKVFDVTPGEHGVQVRRVGLPFGRKALLVSVDAGQVVELACWLDPLTLGLSGLHLATPRESAKMRKIVKIPDSPRNLGASDNS